MKRTASIGLLMALLAAAAGCRQSTTAKAEGAVGAPQSVAVLVATARERVLTRMAEVQGALFPKENTVIAAEVSGPVARVLADFGDSVSAGKPLLKIDPREYQLKADSAQASLDQANARLAHARADYQRGRELHSERMMSAAQFDQLSATLKIAEADAEAADKALGLARKKLADTMVKAPFQGFVQKRLVSLGQYANPGDKLYEFLAIDPMRLRVAVPERYVPLAKIGLEVSMTIDANPSKVYTGKVTRIAPALDDTSRTLLVEAEVANPDGSLRPGYFAHVRVSLGQGRGLFVPQSAVLRYAGVERVFVIEDGIAHSREVTTGAQLGDQIEIISGLKPGEQIAASDIDRLADGVKVSAQRQS